MFSPAFAQQQLFYQKLSSGTGFIINRGGDVVTNAHVLKNCQAISVLNDQGEVPAQQIARDDRRDLAVIRTTLTGEQMVAPLRWNISDLRVGDEVAVFGYPGRAGAMGQSRYARTKVTSLNGPQGEENWIQLSHVIEHGNSGGPVLDTSGNVIGVIAAIAQAYRADAAGNATNELLGESDVAITLADLQDFLQTSGVGFYQSATATGTGYSDGILAQNAYKFIVPIRCAQGIVR